MRHSMRVIRAHLRVGILNLLQYRGDFYLSLVDTGIWITLQLVGLSIIYGHTVDLNGWGHADLIALSGVYLLVNGLINTVVRPSMWTLSDAIRHGTFDFVLTKPADAQLLASVTTVRAQGFTDVLAGTIVILVALTRMEHGPGVTGALLFFLMLVCGFVMLSSAMLSLAATAFWLVQTGDLMRLFKLQNAGAWPITIYPMWMRIGLTIMAPVAVAVTIPAQALAGTLPAVTAVGMVLLAGGFVIVSRMVWRYALRHYTGASA